jgi:hypothetical protein
LSRFILNNFKKDVKFFEKVTISKIEGRNKHKEKAMLEVNKTYIFDCGTLHTDSECQMLLDNTSPVHDLPKKTQTRYHAYLDLLKSGKGIELPPILIFIGDYSAKTGCHRHHAYLELQEQIVDCIVPVFLVTPDQKIKFFKAIGGYSIVKDNLYVLQEKFHRWLVKEGLYTKRILNRRIKEIK